MIKIIGGVLVAEIDEMGAELCRLYSLDYNHEFLWRKTKDVWSSSSPWLFPIVGKLKNDSYCFKGKTYRMEKHGFAQKSIFAVSHRTENSVTLFMENNEVTKKSYPFAFELEITYTIISNKIHVCAKVKNKDNHESMFFSIGAHPGFNCGLGDYLRFECSESVQAFMLNDDKLLRKEKQPLLLNSDIIHLTSKTFAQDALILEDFKSKSVELISFAKAYKVKLNFDTPYLSLWAKPSAPYVCIEPWFGIDDAEKDDYGEIQNKMGIQDLQSNSVFNFEYSIKCSKL